MKALTLPNLESSNHLIDDFLSSGSVHYVYQPVIDVTTSKVRAYEVFVRHIQGARSNILTALPMSPQHRFRLDLHGVNAVSNVLTGNPEQDVAYMLNIDAETLLSPNFYNEVKSIVSQENAKRIMLEITSRTFIDPEHDDVIYNIKSLSEYGFSVGIDSIGTRSSNLPLIILTDISFIKLDSWLSENIENKRIQFFVKSIASFSEKSGVSIFSKDIESKKQSDIMRDCNVVLQQGVYFSEPEVFDAINSKH